MSTTALMTFAEFEQLPEMPGKQELIDGELIIMPPPEWIHSQIAKQVFLLLLTGLDKGRVWPDHTGYRIGSGWIEPDASVTWPDQKRDEKYFVASPMIAVEILSPGEDTERKLTLYFSEGALEVWVVDSKRKAMTVYSRSSDQVVRRVVDKEYYSDAAHVTVSLAELFG